MTSQTIVVNDGDRVFESYMPIGRPTALCPTPFRQPRNKGGYLTFCGHWSCPVCRERKRFHEKEQNAPIAFCHATHTFLGSAREFEALRKRLDRLRVENRMVKVRRESYAVSQGNDRIAAVLAVHEGEIDVASKLRDLVPTVSWEVVIFITRAIDAVPDSIGLATGRVKIKRFNCSFGWNKLRSGASEGGVL